ncbi:hypothetical protein NE237_012559 [Protea cynaroides]|uniref:Uncharacterized protein n=1 Tax=Protea cynaroides TaxID=273540 RepID=A0A9Q0GX03_9MAGN|nr:hypothetical protein NE237_012559 [Protea cynaroides]
MADVKTDDTETITIEVKSNQLLSLTAAGKDYCSAAAGKDCCSDAAGKDYQSEMDGSTKQPQSSRMFHKFALAFKTKTIKFFAEQDEDDNADTLSILDSTEEIITG